ncbi:YncE family protein [Nitrogeniibacter mangrovi]|uniref:YncE family protein n=2 Tax=Nitrogeniibacter mangrovi TaxID=2016596 RepID=A0A6C1BA98_9RHOO|nr:YncE family protein [Nitrogeniibacter mangrovi]
MKHLESIAKALLVFGAVATADAAPTAYIPLGTANEVIAVDTASHRIIQHYTGVANPHGLVVTPDGEYLIAGSLTETPLAAGASADTPNSKLYVIHPVHGHVMSEIPVAGWTHHEAITPDGRYVISTHPTRGGVSVVDLDANRVIKTILTGATPNYTIVTRDGKRAYVSNTGDASLSEIDVASWTVSRRLDAGPTPEHLVFSPDEQSIYVSNDRKGTVSVISVASGKVEKTYTIGKRIHGLDLGDDGFTLFASDRAGDRLVAVDTRTGEQREITLSPAPYHLDRIAGTGTLYVSSSKAAKIWVIDQQQFKVTATIDLPGGAGHQAAVIE